MEMIIQVFNFAYGRLVSDLHASEDGVNAKKVAPNERRFDGTVYIILLKNYHLYFWRNGVIYHNVPEYGVCTQTEEEYFKSSPKHSCIIFDIDMMVLETPFIKPPTAYDPYNRKYDPVTHNCWTYVYYELYLKYNQLHTRYETLEVLKAHMRTIGHAYSLIYTPL